MQRQGRNQPDSELSLNGLECYHSRGENSTQASSWISDPDETEAASNLMKNNRPVPKHTSITTGLRSTRHSPQVSGHQKKRERVQNLCNDAIGDEQERCVAQNAGLARVLSSHLRPPASSSNVHFFKVSNSRLH